MKPTAAQLRRFRRVYFEQAQELQRACTRIDEYPLIRYVESPESLDAIGVVSRWLTRDNQIILLLHVHGERVTRYLLVETYP